MALSQRSRTILTLYSSNDDAQCHRVRLVLAAKGVVYDLVPVTAKNPPEDLLDLNPYNSVPTLVDRDLVLYDTGVICEYLDERYPHPPLMPVDPLSRARLRLATVRIERDWLPFVAQIQAGGRPADTARKRLREALIASVPLFKAAKFFLNPELSLADCALAPLIWRLPSLGVALPREAHVIIDYGERIFRNPGFTRSLTPEEKLLREP
jgi:RNA polymerase-associated protein